MPQSLLAPFLVARLLPVGDRPVTAVDDGAGMEPLEVVLHGELDAADAAPLAARLHRLLDAGTAALLIDLREVTFVDSDIIGVIRAVADRLASSPATLTLAHASPELQRTFALVGCGALITARPGTQRQTQPHHGAAAAA